MTELKPVAYMLSDFVDNDFTSLELPENPNNPRGLYFKEQLRQRMKMTQEQHRRFENYKANNDSFYHFWQSVLDGGVSLFKDISEHDLMLAWLDEETIEIVPNMKWFVEKKKFNGDYKFLKINEKDLHYNHLKEQATQFDTKEEAEKWTNPLTEAVRLPVEE